VAVEGLHQVRFGIYPAMAEAVTFPLQCPQNQLGIIDGILDEQQSDNFVQGTTLVLPLTYTVGAREPPSP
jgi:hypothetical protein